MPAAKPELIRLLTAAADLRAAGKSWEAVAAQLGRSPETCRRWPKRFRAVWDEIYKIAEQALLGEARAEATATLRSHLRLNDTKQTRDAAKALLSASTRERPAKERRDELTIDGLVDSATPEQADDLTDTTKAILQPDATD